MLALQASAGNQAVARMLQRFYEKPGATRKEQPKTTKNKLKEGWVQNGREPLDRVLLQEGSNWYVWSQNKREWQPTDAPADKTTEVEASKGDEAEQVEEKPRKTVKLVPPVGLAHAPIKDLKSQSGMQLGGTKDKPGGALPDAFVEQVFGYLDTASLLALRTMSPWLLEHGSTALREHLHKRTAAHPKGIVGGSLSAMSSLKKGTTLLDQYGSAIKQRPPEKLVMAADKVNKGTIDTLVRGLPKTSTIVHYGTRTDQGTRPDPRLNPVKGPFDDGKHPDVKNSKMHNKVIVGAHGAKDERGRRVDKGDFMISGSPNLTSSAMAANIESAVLIRYPGIAKLYLDYIERVKQQKTDDPKFTKTLKSFNERNVVGIRAALAPFVDIGEQLQVELKGADEITMRMYLVGSGTKHDVVGTLCDLADAKANVEVVVDAKEASSTSYVRQALKRLQGHGVTVGHETGKLKANPRPGEDPHGIMHDKVIMAHYPATAETEERWTVMIGSSGLTKNVDENWNYENLLIIDDRNLFDAMMLHHKDAASHRTDDLPDVDPTSALGKACEALNQCVPKGSNRWASFGTVLRVLPPGVHRDVLREAAAELGMKVTSPRGNTRFSY